MEPLKQTSVYPVHDPSQVALVRRTAADLARAAGLDERRAAAVNVVVSELSNNLLQHAGGGDIYLQCDPGHCTLDIAAVDRGRGMPDLHRCLQDGYTTGSTPGLGLGAVRRFASEFAAFSVPGRTTVVAARMCAADKPADRPSPAPERAVVSTPVHGESISGDSWDASHDGRTLLVVDGLGHGPIAAEAARVAVQVFCKLQHESPQRILEAMHPAMRSTRGAAVAVLQVEPATHTIQFAGIGNIGCSLLRAQPPEIQRSQSMVSHNGTVGHQVRRVQQFQYTYRPNDLLLMQSDGLVTHSKQGLPPGLLAQAPIAIAPFLFAEQVRGRDDATLLVNRLA